MPYRSIALLLGATLLTVPAAAANEGFTGSFSWGPDVGENQWEQRFVDFSDPRLEGRIVMTANTDQLDDDGLYVYAFRIENDKGSWQGGPVTGLEFDGSDFGTSVHVLVGRGGYEGLTAVAEVRLSVNTFFLRGLIVEGPIPEL